MQAKYAQAEPAERVVGRFLCEYHKIWQNYFPGLIKRAHWHVLFAARCSPASGVPCRSVHRALYGLYGTDIRTCVERIKDCEAEGFIKILDASGRPCAASPVCLIATSERLRDSFDRHCRDTIAEVAAVFGEPARLAAAADCDAAAAALFDFFNGCDRKWRETCETVVRQTGLTPAHVNDAMDHLVTYQYWAIVMLLWWASPFGSDQGGSPALVIDEINSRMWDALRLGHLAIKERVGNLIRWGFFAEHTIKKHKAVSLTPMAGAAISAGLAQTRPLLHELYARLVPQQARFASAQPA
jgi:hypothetical protein